MTRDCFSHQLMQKVIRYIAAVVTNRKGGGMTKNDGGFGIVQNSQSCAPRGVGEVHYHPQSVHFIHHSLEKKYEEKHKKTHLKTT